VIHLFSPRYLFK